MKNIGLLTKESINQFKNKWMLFLFYLLFLIISMAIIIGLIHFTYSFGHDAKRYDTLDRVTSLRIGAPQVNDKNDVKKGKGTYYDFASKFIKDNDKNAAKDKALNYVLANRGNVPVSDDKDSLFYKTSDSMHNLFIKWILQSDNELNKEFSSKDGKLLEVIAQQLNLGILDNSKMKIGMVDVAGPKVKVSNLENKFNEEKTSSIYNWQIRNDKGRWVYRIVDSIRGFELNNFDPEANANDVIVTPAFLKFNHYKLGETRTLLYGGKDYKIRFAATAITPGQTVSDKSNFISLNPYLYNQIFEANYKPVSPMINIIDFNVPERDSKKFNQVCAEEYNVAKEILSKSFSSSALETSLQKMSFDATPVHSYQMQLMLYNLISWIVTIILIVLLIAAYRFIQALIINSEKPVLINLKSIGVNSHEIGYYLAISFLPTLLVGSAIGLGLAELVYYLMTQTLGRAVSFTLGIAPRSMLGYIIFAAIFIGLIVIGGFMAWMSTRGKRLSIHSKAKLSRTEMLLLDLKNVRLFKNNGFGNVIYSFQISNLLKAFSTFIVTILSLTVLGISLQFLVSIGSALNDKPYIYKGSGESLSYREYSEGQIVNTDKPLKDYTEIKNAPLKNSNGNPYDALISWEENVVKNNKDTFKKPMYDLYFNDLKSLESFYKSNENSLKNKDYKNEFNEKANALLHTSNKDLASQVYEGFVQLDKLITTYRTEFGNREELPKVFFKNRPITKDWVGYEEMHMAVASSYNIPIAVFNQDPKDKKQLQSDEIIVNNFALRRFNLKVGQKINIKFSGISALNMINGKTNKSKNNVANDEISLKVVGVNEKLYNQAEAVVNFDNIRSVNSHEYMKKYQNGVVSRSPVPYDIKNFVIPVGLMKNDGTASSGATFKDYFPDAFNSNLVTELSFSSLPIIHQFYMKQTAEFRSFATILSVLLVLVCLCIVLVISILIAYENKNNILVLKTLGYSVGKTLSLFSIIYAAFIAIGFIASIFIAGALIDSFTGTLVNRLGLGLTHQYTAETIIVPFVIALVFFMAIIGIVIYSYKKIRAQDITFAE